MRPNPLRRKLGAGQPVIGPLLQEISTSPDLVEFLGAAGFDFVGVDAEHAGASVETARDLARAADAAGIAILARVPTTDPARILAFLDQGIHGLILSHCRTAADAEALVSATKYPPRGIRGAASGSRAAWYGYSNPTTLEHVQSSDAETLCFGLIEDPEGVPNVRGMLEVDGFDGCFLGAGDLALSLGREYFGGPTTHPEVQTLIDQVRQETLAAGKLVMAPAGNGQAARAWIAQGVQIVVVQFGQFFRGACNAYLQAARGEPG